MKDGCVEADMDKDGTISVGKETDVLMGFLNQNGINYGGSFDKVLVVQFVSNPCLQPGR